MNNRAAIILAATATVLCYSGLALAADPAPGQPEISQEIKALRTRIDQLEQKEKAEQLQRHEAEQKLDEKITTEKLAGDVAQRDQFLSAEGFTAGYSDGKFIIQDTEGNFTLHPWAHLQLRGVVNQRNGHQGSAINPEDEVDSGFEVRQLRFGADGNMFSPDLTYFFNWATQRNSSNVNVVSTTGTTKGTVIGTAGNSLGGVPVLQQSWVKYHIPTSPFYLKAGEMKDPVLHEQIVDTRFQQGAERSIAADIFVNGDAFTEAATIIYDPNTFIRAEGGINHGMRGANTNFESYPNNGSFNQFNYGFVGRVDYKVKGNWKDYNQVGGAGIKDPLLVFGVGSDYSERGHDGQLVSVVDATYVEPSGLNLYGEFLNRYTTHNFGYYINSPTGASINAGDPAVAGHATDEYAVVLQAGYMLDQHWEPFGRYEYMHLQGTPAGSHNYIQAVAGGINYYFHGYRLKATGELQWLPNGLPFDDISNDVLANTNGKSEITFIAQLQLLL
ncbi:MAG TPA: hypothetical protein VFE47_10070 [Tepidisphaeraceae bacterium]|jgi:hypothetical protein|nr:hypothetical protein [Tepidisphaeraceae bacterium]